MIRTARLVLRPAREDDLDDLWAIYSDPRAMRYWSVPPHPDASVTADLLGRIMANPAPQTYLMFEMDGRVIGTGGRHGKNEIGFILHPDYWRRGLAVEGMTALIAHIFAVTDLDELTADVDPLNAGSVAVLARLGFHQTGTARNTYCINGVWSDSRYFALPRPGVAR